MASNLMRVVASSVSIARQAGNAIRKIMKSGNLDIVDKAEKDEKYDPQTKADRVAQSIIIGSLRKQFPQLKIIGEEEDCDEASDDLVVTEHDENVMKHKCPTEFENLKIEDFIVWVDPLDGTKEFTEGAVEHVTVLIGISAFGKAVAGVINQPFYQTDGRTMWGVANLGAFGVVQQKRTTDQCIITTTKSHLTQLVTDTIDAMKPDLLLRTGGCGYKVLQVIEGTADAYVFATPGTKKWDTCAPEAILTALGGCMTDILNEQIDYSKTDKKYFMNWTGLLCANRNHMKFAHQVPEEVKRNLRETRDAKLY